MFTRKIGVKMQENYDELIYGEVDYPKSKAFGLGFLEGLTDWTLVIGVVSIGAMVYAKSTGQQIDINFVKKD